jgi:hypothetical protein
MKITCVRTMALSTVILIMASSIAPAQKTGMAQAVSIVQRKTASATKRLPYEPAGTCASLRTDYVSF